MSDVAGNPSFEDDIKPLFRQKDQRSMKSSFDLWEYEDVKANATAILEVVEAGDMPCDGAWPEEHVELFRRWTEAGMAP